MILKIDNFDKLEKPKLTIGMWELRETTSDSDFYGAYFYHTNIVTKSQWPYPHIEAVINRYKVDELGYQIEIKLWEEWGQWDSFFEAFVEKDAISNKDKFLDIIGDSIKVIQI
jgi:hypothetical protein